MVVRHALLILVAPAVALLACGAGARGAGDTGGGGSGGDDAGAFGSGEGGVFGGTGGDGGAPTGGGTTILYAHTDTTLFSFDPTNLTAPPTSLGKFDCIGGGSGAAVSMTDLAVTKDGKLYGVSGTAAYPLTVQPGGGVHCDATWPLPSNAQFYGLTIAPENTVASAEVLVAANSAGQLFQLDATSGMPTEVGTLGTDPQSGKPWSLSGDIVFLANGGNPVGFATVRTCSSGGTCSTVDTLVEVDVTAIHPGKQSVLKAVRGQVVRGSWCTNPSSPQTFGSMFGIAAFHDKVYGWSRKGDLIEIDNADGSGCLVQSLGNDAWAGAGVTTTAPIQAPPPK